MEPEQYRFADDGIIPNSRFPLLVYRKVFTVRGEQGAQWLEALFAANRRVNSWRNGVYGFHHYHSTSHEVLGVYAGSALLQFGGEKGEKVPVAAGDIIVIPAGVGHKRLEADGLAIVGAYPYGQSWDINKGEPGERPKADQNIAELPLPTADPLLGSAGGLLNLWE